MKRTGGHLRVVPPGGTGRSGTAACDGGGVGSLGSFQKVCYIKTPEKRDPRQVHRLVQDSTTQARHVLGNCRTNTRLAPGRAGLGRPASPHLPRALGGSKKWNP